MLFGVCYYPEHWPEERWATDARMMQEAGMNVVRIGEFAWSKLERREGEFDFSWLDRIIDLLAGHGIRVIFGTPTATPPKWLMDKHPDIYMRDKFGHVRGFGNRRHYCYNAASYQPYIQKIVERLASRYANNPNILAWQIDNEFGCNDTTRCYCENCRTAFHVWLQEKYGDIDAMNERWGTVFWSQIYNEWHEIVLPANTPFPLHNPGLELDYRRFASDSVCKFQKFQTDLIRSIAPHQTVTHNLMGTFNEIDGYDLSEELDIVSWDNYPNLMFTRDVNPAVAAMSHDMTRGLKERNFWVMEHQSGQPGGNVMFPTPKPQELRRWTYQSIAHGADGILYFRWRGCLFGAEQFWHAILQHDGKPGRKYAETKAVGEELKRVSRLLEGTENRPQAAMIRSYDNEWTFEIQPHIMNYSYMDHFTGYYQFFYDHHIGTDIVSPAADFTKYKLLVLSNFIMATDDMVERLYAFVEAGGSLVLDFRAGAKDWDNRMEPLTLPGKFAELLGITVEEYGVLFKDDRRRIKANGQDADFGGGKWVDVIELRGAEALAVFDEDYYAGRPAVTKHAFGQGHAYYIGTEIDASLRDHIFGTICGDAGITLGRPAVSAPPGVEVVSRSNETREYTFVINHTVDPVIVDLDGPIQDWLSGRVFEHGPAELEGNGVWMLGRPAAE
ncbi:beta-galactosidase [Paenibacillus sacheonensis]|uniref:Beta-galactosidase n=1 Tax=Paenibacillus sacheonensis TaxID=742054 RepID=A0A7X5BX49_9BACL|nr:beta-galactosidase [Paenibacillus sacheonensis]MBM7563434.1 beta-galactosidase [Paenibacillus sacheonensis]NBC68011.1 cellulase family glycosylhydrolase [Paenibacillus sacheonensis]